MALSAGRAKENTGKPSRPFGCAHKHTHTQLLIVAANRGAHCAQRRLNRIAIISATTTAPPPKSQSSKQEVVHDRDCLHRCCTTYSIYAIRATFSPENSCSPENCFDEFSSHRNPPTAEHAHRHKHIWKTNINTLTRHPEPSYILYNVFDIQ